MSALKNFMTRLANVYRTATGSTDKIVASTIPDLYEELLENFSGGGSGGESTDVASIKITLPHKYYSIGYKMIWEGAYDYQTMPMFIWNTTTFSGTSIVVGSELYLQVTDTNYMSKKTVTVPDGVELCANKSDCIVLKPTKPGDFTVTIN